MNLIYAIIFFVIAKPVTNDLQGKLSCPKESTMTIFDAIHESCCKLESADKKLSWDECQKHGIARQYYGSPSSNDYGFSLKSETNYQNNKLHGPYTEWMGDGKRIRVSGHYWEGKPDGKWQIHSYSGNLKYEVYFNKTILKEVKLPDNNKLKFLITPNGTPKIKKVIGQVSNSRTWVQIEDFHQKDLVPFAHEIFYADKELTQPRAIIVGGFLFNSNPKIEIPEEQISQHEVFEKSGNVCLTSNGWINCEDRYTDIFELIKSSYAVGISYHETFYDNPRGKPLTVSPKECQVKNRPDFVVEALDKKDVGGELWIKIKINSGCDSYDDFKPTDPMYWIPLYKGNEIRLTLYTTC